MDLHFLYVTDLHGDTRKFETSLRLAQEEGADAIVNGGDLLPRHMHRHEAQPAFMYAYLDNYFARCGDAGIQYVFIPGNNDLASLDDDFRKLSDKHECLHDIDGSLTTLNGYDFIGMSEGIDTPSRCKDRVAYEENYRMCNPSPKSALLSTADGYEEIKDWREYYVTKCCLMEEYLYGLPEPKDFRAAVYVMHTPPAGLGLDLSYTGEAGSLEILRFLDREQPLISLHGHIHESPALSKRNFASVGSTSCVQPGQTKPGGELRYVDCFLKDGEVRATFHTAETK